MSRQNPDGALSKDSVFVHEALVQAHRAEDSGALGVAKHLYLTVLERYPSHYQTLIHLGRLLKDTQYRSAARLTFLEVLRHHPQDPYAHLMLGHLAREDQDWTRARLHYEMAIASEFALWPAHQGLSYVFEELDQPDKAQYHRDVGFSHQPMQTMPYRGTLAKPLLVVLLMVSTTGGNTPTAPLLDLLLYQVEVIVVEYWQINMRLPFHDLIFNGISDADLSSTTLAAAERIVETSGKPVINPPHLVAKTGRVQVAERLSTITGVRTPRMVWYKKADWAKSLSACDIVLRWPFLLRSKGYHTGRHFVSVRSPEELQQVLSDLPGEDILGIERLDTRHSDGLFRKYRVMMVGGALYPLHLAFSTDWKVHYYTAIRANPAYDEQETSFLEDMEGTLGVQIMQRLGVIRDLLELDYGGIDFDLDATGDVIVFEANATMVLPSLIGEPPGTARHRAIKHIIDAVHGIMVLKAHPGDKP